MDRQKILVELKDFMETCLKEKGLDLVDLIYRYEGNSLFLRALVDKPEGGISLDECAHLNEEIGRILDDKDIVRQSYILEVSSPGLDRPLVTKSDFLRCNNRNVRFFLDEPINGKMELQGTITKIDGDSVYIKDLQGKLIEIPLRNINKAKQVIDII